MYYSDISFTFQDYPEPEETALLIFVSGCSNNCIYCQNKSLQNPKYGTEITDVNDFVKLLENKCKENNTKNIVIEGGDPLFISNIYAVKEIISLMKGYNFCIYTGYSIKETKKYYNKKEVKYYKCGLYDAKLNRISGKTEKEFVLASSNQDFYDTNFHRISKKGVLKFGLWFKLRRLLWK